MEDEEAFKEDEGGGRANSVEEVGSVGREGGEGMLNNAFFVQVF